MTLSSEKQFPAEPATQNDKLLWDIFLSRYHLPALNAGDELGIFELLAKRSSSLQEIAQYAGISERGAEPLLGLLCSLGLISRKGTLFSNTEVANTYLDPNSPYYWGGVLQMNRTVDFQETHVLDALRTKTQFDFDGEGDMWKRLETSSELAASFAAQMHSFSFSAAMAVSYRGNFDGVTKLLDIAGGSGCFAIAIAKRHQNLKASVLELPVVCPITEGYIADFGIEQRVNTVACDMFNDPWPTDYDGILFSHVFHDWDRKRCEFLAQRAFESLPSGGRVFVHETLLDDDKASPLGATAMSMNMLVYSEGKQYSASEIDAILTQAGFAKVSVVPTQGYYSLITAEKP